MKWVLAFVMAMIGGMVSMLAMHMFFGWIFPEAAMDAMPKEALELEAHILELSFRAKTSVLVAHWTGTWIGAAIVSAVSPKRHMWPALTIGALFLLSGISNALIIPMPIEMIVIDLLGYLPAAYLAGWLLVRPTR